MGYLHVKLPIQIGQMKAHTYYKNHLHNYPMVIRKSWVPPLPCIQYRVGGKVFLGYPIETCCTHNKNDIYYLNNSIGRLLNS